MIIHCDNRNVYLKFKEYNLLEVRVPKHYTKKKIDALLKRKRKWIEDNFFTLEKFDENTRFDPEYFVYLDYKYWVIECPEMGNRYVLDDEELTMMTGIDVSTPDKRALLYKKMAHKFIKPLAYQMAESVGLKPQKIIIRGQKTKWGTCSSKGNISLNWKLMLAPKEVIEYVIMHELLHLKYPNHQKEFKKVLLNIFPATLQAELWLNSHGGYLRKY